MLPFPLPRFRTLQPLIDGDGTCSLVYDAERATVVDVPEDLRFHVARALESGDLDEDLVGWLASEDLLTAESWEEWSGHATSTASQGGGADAAGRGLAALGLGGEEVHGWIDTAPERLALEELAMVFRRGCGSSRLKLHLDWVGTFPPDGLFEKVVAEARRRAAVAGQEVAFELALDADQVTPEVARRLAGQAVHVRLRCGESGPLGQAGTPHEHRPWLLAEPVVKLMLAHLPPAALTVQCLLDGPSRLIELWRWAVAAGVRSLDVIRLEQLDGGAAAAPTAVPWLRAYAQDLAAIHDETCRELEAGRLPVDLQPLTRMVRRLMRHEPLAGMLGIGAGDEMLLEAGLGPYVGMESLDPRQLPELMWLRLEQRRDRDGRGGGAVGHASGGAGTSGTSGTSGAAAGLSGREGFEGFESADHAGGSLPCKGCWARQVCGHSAFVASPLGGEDPREPSRERCAIWFAEVETAIRLYHRLGQIDALQVLRFLHGDPEIHHDSPIPAMAHPAQRFDGAGMPLPPRLETSKPS